MTPYRSRFGSRGKYNAVKVQHDGWTFDSTAEGMRYLYWKSELLAGRITALIPDPFAPPAEKDKRGKDKPRPGGKRHWVLVPGCTKPDGKKDRPITFSPDFEVTRGSEFFVEDFKGRSTEGFRLRLRLWWRVYPTTRLWIVRADGTRSLA